MAQKGDKIGWGSDDKRKPSHGSGWIYDGTHWVQYKKNKPTGRKEKHRVSTTAARGLGVGSLVKKIRGKDNKNTLTKNTKSKLTETDKADIKKEEGLTKTMAALKKGGGTLKDPGPGKKGSFIPSNQKTSTGGKKKKMHAIEKRNREIHGDTKVQALKDRHAAWKKARKEGTLAEWEKTHHPNRTPQYRKKKKKQNLKVESKKETPNAFNKKLKSKLTDKQVYKPTPNAYTTKLESKLTDSKVYKKKKKK